MMHCNCDSNSKGSHYSCVLERVVYVEISECKRLSSVKLSNSLYNVVMYRNLRKQQNY